MNVNLFSITCMVMAVSAFIKVFFGVFYHTQLYAWAKKHYTQAKPTTAVVCLMVYALALLVTVWIGTIWFYQPKGWILTAFITLASVKSLSLLFNWKSAALKFASFIDTAGKKLWLVDIVVAVMGIAFLCLALLVY